MFGKYGYLVNPWQFFDGENVGAGAGAGQTGDDAGAQANNAQNVGELGAKTFSQEDVDRIVKERLEREQKKFSTAAEKARKDAEEAALAKNAEWQQLAEQRGSELEKLTAQVGEIEGLKAQSDRYRSVLEGYAKAQVEKLPKAVQGLLEKMDPADQLEWLTANASELTRKPSGLPETPDPNEKVSAAHREKARTDFAKTVRSW